MQTTRSRRIGRRIFLSALCGWLAWGGPPFWPAQSSVRGDEPESRPDSNQAAESPWTRVVMLGASASAGFTAGEPLGGPMTPRYRLSHYVDAALSVPHEPVRNYANALFFMMALPAGQAQVQSARDAQATLVVAVDFMFWFCYGKWSNDEDRLQRFEEGLRLLDQIPCPILVGDVPDASATLGIMLQPADMAPPAVREQANRRLRAWAASRPRVMVFPLADTMAAIQGDRALAIRDAVYPPGPSRRWIQADRLHPSSTGAAALALTMLSNVQASLPQTLPQDVRWDLDAVHRDVLQRLNTAASRSSEAAPQP